MTFEETLEKHGQLVYPNKGVSMMPLLREGRDLMVIQKKGAERCKKYDAVLFKRANGQYIMHRILKVRDKDYLIVGDNCWQKEYVPEDRVLGVLTEVLRNGKTVRVTDLKYRTYVHLWCDCFPVRAALLWLRAHIRRFGGRILRKLGLRK